MSKAKQKMPKPFIFSQDKSKNVVAKMFVFVCLCKMQKKKMRNILAKQCLSKNEFVQKFTNC